MTFFRTVILVPLLIFAVIRIYGALRTYRSRLSLIRRHDCKPPKTYPHKEPILGLDLVYAIVQSANQGRFLESHLQRHRTYGRTFQTTSFGKTIINTVEPKILSTVFATASDNFGVVPFREPPAKPLVGRGVFTTDGAEWAHSRGLIRPCFTRTQVADLTLLKVHVDRLLELIPRDGSTIDLQALFCRLSLDSSTEFLFGESLQSLQVTKSAEADNFLKAFNVAQYGVGQRVRLGKLRFLYQGRKWLEACSTVHSFIDKYVERAVDSSKFRDHHQHTKHYILLNEMAKVTKDPTDLRYQILNVFLAGHESTAIALSSIFFHLARNPIAWRKLRSEVIEFGNVPLTFESLKSLRYLRYIISESLRLNPVAPFMTRMCFHDTILPAGGGPDGLCPLLIQAGQTVSVSTYALHRDRSFWGDDADRFQPERWDSIRPKWDYLPFGGGTRICPAQQLALTEVAYVVVRLVREFRMVESRDEGPWVEMLKMTLASKNGVQVGMIPA